MVAFLTLRSFTVVSSISVKNAELPMSNVLHAGIHFCSSRGKVRKETSLRDFLFHLILIGYIKHLDFQSFNTVGANFSILRKFVFCVLIFRPYLCNFNFINSQRLDYEQDKRQQTTCSCGKQTATGSTSDKRGVHPCWHYLVQGG